MIMGVSGLSVLTVCKLAAVWFWNPYLQKGFPTSETIESQKGKPGKATTPFETKTYNREILISHGKKN